MYKLFFSIVIYILVSTSVKAQTCNIQIEETAPSSRYTLNNDVVTDKLTGLMWFRCAIGQTWEGNSCIGIADGFDWEDALTQASNIDFSGYSDWYLPNVKELGSLIEEACDAPAMNLSVFNGISDSRAYWTSTPAANNGGDAHFVLLKEDLTPTRKKSNLFYVLPVRKAN